MTDLDIYIIDCIENSNLKDVAISLLDENKSIYKNSISYVLTHQDQFIYNTLLGISYAKNSKYQKSLNHYQKAKNIFSKNKIDKYCELFFQINKEISVGYHGDPIPESFIEEINTTLKKYNFVNDIISFGIRLADVATYRTAWPRLHHIKNLEKIIKNYPENVKNNKKLFIHIRLGTLHFLEYRDFNKRKDCMKAKNAFELEVQNSDNEDYTNYWAKCGVFICKTQLREKNPNDYLINRPGRHIKEAYKYPTSSYLIAKAKIMQGDLKGAMGFLREFKYIIEKQLNESSNKKLVVEKHKIILDEWMFLIYEFYIRNIYSEKRTCESLIEVNEISRYRLLSENLKKTNEYLNHDFRNILNTIKSNKSISSILYITDSILSIGERNLFFIIFINPEKNEIKLKTKPVELMGSLKKEWNEIIESKSNNQRINDFINTFKYQTDLDEIITDDRKNMIIIPNKLFNKIPFNLMSNYGNIFEYWPNINTPAFKIRKKYLTKSIDIIYDSNEKNALKEKKTINEICNNWDKKDYEINNLPKSTSKSSILHYVCHFDGINIKNKNESMTYEYQQFFNNIDKNNKLIVLNMCRGNENLIRNNVYDSVPLFLILKGVETVICHSWELGQHASLKFSEIFYNQLNLEKNISDSFQITLKKIKHEFNINEYGGYTLWGNGKLKVKNGS